MSAAGRQCLAAFPLKQEGFVVPAGAGAASHRQQGALQVLHQRAEEELAVGTAHGSPAQAAANAALQRPLHRL